MSIEFQSTCPARGTTAHYTESPQAHNYFNPRAPRGARHDDGNAQLRWIDISIHVPREGHDVACDAMPLSNVISIHVPREGHDSRASPSSAIVRNFNPRAPRGARHFVDALIVGSVSISIHVPREGHDRSSRGRPSRPRNFNPRAPRGARHYRADCTGFRFYISIHVPREGHDLFLSCATSSQHSFQSTCPARGTTHRYAACKRLGAGFQSTCPARGTTL